MTASGTASAGPVAGDRTARTADGLDRAIRRVDEAVMTIRSGDPQPYIDCWADDPDVTLFGAWGPIELGYPAVTGTFHWVGSRFTGHSGGGAENTVVFERGPVSVDGGPERDMVIRVTHIYRRFGEEWMLVHRHADFPPADQR